MKQIREVEDWTIEKLEQNRSRISFPEYQREKSLWTKEKKSALIDSILKDFDIPKLYFNRLKDKTIEVIDGQQRLWSVWEFLGDEYSYSPDGGKGKIFTDLTPTQQRLIKNYEFQVTVFDAADDEYLRELFVRLQLGLLLNTGEKLHAATGKMKHLVFSELVKHKFIGLLGISVKRYSRETLCAQICINSFSTIKLGQYARTRYDDLINFFAEYADPQGKDLELFNKQSKLIPSTFDLLWDCFHFDGNKIKSIRNRSFILSIYLFVEDWGRRNSGMSAERQAKFKKFIFTLWERLSEEKKKGIDRTNRELYSFENMLSSASGEAYQIKRRQEKLVDYFGHFVSTGKLKGDR